MRQYAIEAIHLSGYRKFGKAVQSVKVAYPDLKTPGSGLNIIVGAIGSGKTSFLEMINFASTGGFPDHDQMIINDELRADEFPKVAFDLISLEPDGAKPISYQVEGEFSLDGRRLNAALSKQYPESADGSDYPNEGNFMKFIRPNREFIGKVDNLGPALQNGTNPQERSESINLAGIISSIKNLSNPDAILEAYKTKLKEYSRFGLDVEDLKIPTPTQRGVTYADLEVKLRSGKWHNVQDLSDGTKELMWWIYELFFGDVNNFRTVCIDEIERSLHPQIQMNIMELIYERSAHLQFFITTHSTYIANPHNKCMVHRFDRDGNIHSVPSEEFDKPSIFTSDHNRLFFEDSVLFVEGIDDMTFYKEKMMEYGYDELVNGIFYANTKDNIEKFSKICEKLGIKFHAIVDDDYTDKPKKLNKDKKRTMERTIDALKSSDNIKGVPNLSDLEKEMSKPPSGSASRKSEMVVSKNYRKVISFDIYPLRYGELENYKLGKDRDGKDVSADQAQELRDIFDQINLDRSRDKG